MMTKPFFTALAFCTSILPASAGWESATYKDPLDEKQTSKAAVARAKEDFDLNGEPIRTWLRVTCYKSPSYSLGSSTPKMTEQLIATIVFSRPVAFSERLVRWRVDDGPINKRTSKFWDGTTFYLSSFAGITNSPDNTAEELGKGAHAKFEIDLPYSNSQIVDFDLSGGEGPFKDLQCKTKSRKGTKTR